MTSNEEHEDFEDSSHVMDMLSANLPQSVFNPSAPDPRLQRAWQETERTNKITPVLKEELRCKILAKRLEKGEPELETAFGEPKKYELTEEEQRKRERRKEQNRRAAKKCREKRKMKNLSDAEKSELIVEDNQKLKFELTLLRHKKRILETFCMKHILQQRCTKINDIHINEKLKNMIDFDTEGCADNHNEGCYRSSPGASQPSSRGFPSAPIHGKIENSTTMSTKPITLSFTECSASPVLVSNPSVAANADEVQPQQAESDTVLQVLPVHEVSSLLPPGADFNISDSASDSTPPLLSPSSLFTTAHEPAGTATNTPFFNHDITPNRSFSSSDISMHSSTLSNQTLPGSSYNDSNISPDSSFPRSISYADKGIVSSTPISHVAINEQLFPSTIDSDDVSRFTYKQHTFGEYPVVSTTDASDYQTPSSLSTSMQVVMPTDAAQGDARPDTSHTRWEVPNHSQTSAAIDIGETTVTIPNNEAILNTALMTDIPGNVEVILINYFFEQSHSGNALSTCNLLPTQTGPISPMTLLSPSSPNFSLSPSSPSSFSTELATYQIMDPVLRSGRFESSAGGIPFSVSVTTNVSNSKAITPTRPIARRSSSNASLPSSYVSPLLNSLSPPPSVPSPSSNGVPESPSILTGYTACDDSRYMPQYSPVSTATSGRPSPVRFLDQLSDEDFNSSG